MLTFHLSFNIKRGRQNACLPRLTTHVVVALYISMYVARFKVHTGPQLDTFLTGASKLLASPYKERLEGVVLKGQFGAPSSSALDTVDPLSLVATLCVYVN